jgi:5-methylthioadenosine/S-adenosylhomocysteine deaminase
MKTLIQGGYVVGYNGTAHIIYENGCVVYENELIIFVGFPNDPKCPDYDSFIDATNSLVSPGFINLHCIANIDIQPIFLDTNNQIDRSKEWFNSNSYIMNRKDYDISARYTIASIIKGGATTFCAVTTMATKRYENSLYESEALVKNANDLGIRGYFANNYQDISYYNLRNKKIFKYNKSLGEKAFNKAKTFSKGIIKQNNDLINTFLFPYTTETCSNALLSDSYKVSKDLNIPIRTHFAQYKAEVENSYKNHKISPLNRLYKLNILDSNLTLTHAIYLNNNYEQDKISSIDLKYLYDSGTNICHCPVVYLRKGYGLNSFQSVVNAGVNIGIGTDTVPPDIIKEMRTTSLLSKIKDEDPTSGSATSVYNAATIGGAKALNRNDLGRLSKGCRADIVIINISNIRNGLIDDPIRSLVYYSNSQDIEKVIVNGKIILNNYKISGIDEGDLLINAQGVFNKIKSNKMLNSIDRVNKIYPNKESFEMVKNNYLD